MALGLSRGEKRAFATELQNYSLMAGAGGGLEGFNPPDLLDTLQCIAPSGGTAGALSSGCNLYGESTR